MIVFPERTSWQFSERQPAFFNGECFCCTPPPPPSSPYYYYYYRRRTITIPACQSCGTLTLPDTLTLTITKLDSDCPCLAESTVSMIFRDTFTHPAKEPNPLGTGVSCTVNSAWGTETPVQDCDRTLLGLTATSLIHFYFQSTGTDKCKLQAALIGSTSCTPASFYRDASAVRVISCSPLNFEFDFDLGGRPNYVDGGLCTNPTHTMILTE